jgi:transposase-like protein
MRRKAEAVFEQKNGGKTTLIQHMWALKGRGLSLRDIARDVSQATGMPVSHETVRRWMLEG